MNSNENKLLNEILEHLPFSEVKWQDAETMSISNLSKNFINLI
jgi:hypothetical protein